MSVLNRLFTEALSWGAVVECSMGSPEIVVVEVTRQAIGSLDRGWVGAFVGPFAQQGLDEAFGFPVGSGTVRSGAQVTELEFLAGGFEPVRDVAGAVVGHDSLDGDAAILEPGNRTAEEGRRGGGSFVRQDFGIGHSRSVVDGDVNELPTDATDPGGAVAMDAVTDTTYTAQLLDVEVDQFAGSISLIPDDRLLGLEALETGEPMTSQDTSHRGPGKAHTSRDLGSSVSSPSQTQHLLDLIRMGLSGHPMRLGTAIDQGRLAGLQEPSLPLEGRSLRDPGRLGGPGHRHPSQDATNQNLSTRRTASGIVVKLHLGSFDELLALDTSSLTDLGPDGQQTWPVNNVLRNES
jgi:hypothetical protein